MNRVTIIGNCGKDPEIRTTQDGREIASLTVATSERWKDKDTGEKREAVEWHKVAVFNQGLVKVIKKYVTKGTKLCIEGKLKTRKWQDNDGNDRYITEIVLNGFGGSLELLGSNGTNNTSNRTDSAKEYERAHNSGYADSSGYEDLEDEIPFN